jgi:hypothetical protein
VVKSDGLSQARLGCIAPALRRPIAGTDDTKVSDDFLTLAYQAIDD